MKAGFASSIINPPVGHPMQGLGQAEGCRAVREDIAVRALALVQGSRRALVLSFDLVFFERPVVDRIKGDLARLLDLTPAEVLLNFTHNHAGPMVSVWSYDQPDPAYLELVARRAADASLAAFAAAREATVFAGCTRTVLPVSRRKLDDSGRAQWLPDASGTTCDALPFCLFKDNGEILALLYSVSCHPSIWHEPEICGDYPGASTRLLNAHFHTTGAIFLQGCGGDSKPCTIAKDGRWAEGDWTDVEAAGRLVADAVIAAANDATPVRQPDLRVVLEEMRWDLTAPSTDAEYEAVRDAGDERPARRKWAQAQLARRALPGGLPKAVPVALHALQIARGVRLIGLEGEAVADIGNQILQTYDQGVTFPLGCTDGAQIYLPSDRQLPQHGYEVDSYWEYHWPAPLAPGIDARLDRHLRQLQADGRIPNEPCG